MGNAGIKIEITLTNHIRGSRRGKSVLNLRNISSIVNIISHYYQLLNHKNQKYQVKYHDFLR